MARREVDLLAACVADPEDDAPRLVWADAVGGERGELVVLQCRLAREDLGAAESGVLRRRERVLLATYGAEWSGLGGIAKKCQFRRGFVESIVIPHDPLVARAREIFAAAPLVGAIEVTDLGGTFDGDSDGVRPYPPARVATVLGLRTLPALSVRSTMLRTTSMEDHDDVSFYPAAVVESILASGALASARAIRLGQNVFGEEAFASLIAGGAFDRIERLVTDEVGRLPVLRTIFERATALTALDVTAPSAHITETIAALPASLVELRIGILDDKKLAALAASPCAPYLERLAIHHSRIASATELFAAFPRLRSLDLYESSFGRLGHIETARAALTKFCAGAMPALRELWLDFPDGTSASEVLDALGPQLELFVTRPELSIADVARVAGEAISRSGFGRDEPLFLAFDRRGPWIARPIVFP